MFSIVKLGAVPLLEKAIEPTTQSCIDQAYEECEQYLDLIRQKIGEEPLGVHLIIVSSAFPYPNFWEIECHFDGQNPKAFQYALECKENLPNTWEDTQKPSLSSN